MPSKRKSGHHKVSPHTQFWTRYGTDVTIVVLILVGLFLIVEQTDVSAIIVRVVKSILSTIGSVISSIVHAIAQWFSTTETSDIIGYILIFIAMMLLGNRLRSRMLQNFPNSRECPHCGSDLHRIHRKTSHKIIGRFLWLRVKHYRCTNSECKWSGIQVSYR